MSWVDVQFPFSSRSSGLTDACALCREASFWWWRMDRARPRSLACRPSPRNNRRRYRRWDFPQTLLLHMGTEISDVCVMWLYQTPVPPGFRGTFYFCGLKWLILKHSIRAASFARIVPQDSLSRLCIDLTCKSFARNASFASGVNAPLQIYLCCLGSWDVDKINFYYCHSKCLNII